MLFYDLVHGGTIRFVRHRSHSRTSGRTHLKRRRDDVEYRPVTGVGHPFQLGTRVPLMRGE